MDPMDFLRTVIDYADHADLEEVPVAYLDLDGNLTFFNSTEPFEETFKVTITPV